VRKQDLGEAKQQQQTFQVTRTVSSLPAQAKALVRLGTNKNPTGASLPAWPARKHDWCCSKTNPLPNRPNRFIWYFYD